MGWSNNAAIVAVALAAAPISAQTLQQRIEVALAAASPGTRFGLVVIDADGREVVAVNPDQRFTPASNTKMFTTATAFALLGGLDEPDAAGGNGVRLEERADGAPDVVIEGRGDARMSGADDCAADCLTTLADAIADRTHAVHDVIGDDSLFPDERWSPGMSWNNIATRSGTATSALTLDDNELAVRVTPGAIGAAPRVALPAYYQLDNRALTIADGPAELTFDRAPNDLLLRIGGTIAAGHAETLRIGIDDPARYAAWRLRELLIARGVRVSGTATARHRPLRPADDPALRNGAPAARPPEPAMLARLIPPPLAEDLILTNKTSQNLHAELLLRRIGLVAGSGSIADGLAAERGVLAQAGLPRVAYDFADGGGMSTYNRVTPRAAATLLRWIAGQPWGAAWRATLPIGGVDGGLARRFAGTALAGKLFAKTGTLNAVNALSGYLIARSGRTFTFSSYANDVPDGVNATRAVDAALLTIAAEN